MGKRVRRKNSPPASRSEPAGPGRRVPRSELLLLLAIVCCGALVRMAFPARMGVEHFDEGVYASNLWFFQEHGFAYHLQHYYAPPLLPSLIEFSLIFEQFLFRQGGRPSSLAVMAPSLLAGVATPLLVWLIARNWFGPAAGLAAAVLVALSDFHAVYSRAALTEALLVFWLLLAVWLGQRACATFRPQLILAAGVVTALAWWTKYSGWLPLAIVAGGLVAEAVCEPAARRLFTRRFACWLAMVAVTLVCWSPWLYQLQEHGGYAAVSVNHRQYVVPLSSWAAGFTQQLGNLRHFDGWLTCLAPAAAYLCVAGLRGRTNGRDDPRANRATPPLPLASLPTLAAALSLAALGAWAGTVLWVALAFLGLGDWFVSRARLRTPTPPSPPWLLLAWLLGLLLITPLYHPYPRLVLPWLCAVWIAAGLGVDALWRTIDQTFADRATGRWAHWGPLLCSLVAAMALVAGNSRPRSVGANAWQPRNAFARLAPEIGEAVQLDLAAGGGSASSALLFVHSEPGLFYNLRAEGLPAAATASLPAVLAYPGADTRLFLVTGPHADRSPQFAAELSQLASRFELIQSFAYVPSDLVLLNQHHPVELARARAEMRRQIRLYRIR